MTEESAPRSLPGDPRAWIVVGTIVAAGLVIAVGLILRFISEGEPAQVLRVALPTFGAEVVDPSADNQAGQQYYGHLFDYMLGANPNGTPSAELGAIESWTSDADAGQYTLNLRRGLTWHDGTEVTADDVKFSLEHYERASPACAECGALDEALERITSVDRYTLNVDLLDPDIAFIDRLGPTQEDVPILPSRHWAGGETHEMTAAFTESPVGSGPWRFAQRVPGEMIEYEANTDYWNADRVPGFSKLRLTLVPDRNNRLAMLQAGIVDMAPFETRDVGALKAEGFQVQGPKYVLETSLRFFMSYDKDYLTSDERFRKALILGMDLPSIIEKVYPPEAATPAGGSPMFSPVAEGYDASLPPYPYDPEQAKALLGDLGYDGQTVNLLSIPVYDQTETPALNALLAQNWQKIGLNVEVVPATYLTVKRRFAARPQEFEDLAPIPVFHGGHVTMPGGIVNAIFRYLVTSPDGLLSYYDMEKGDRIYSEILSIRDVGARQQRLKELNRELYGEYWAAPVVWRHDVWGVRQGLTGWQPTNGMRSHLNFETILPGS